MCHSKAMAETYEQNRAQCKYVHATSRGHEAIQLATAFHLLPCDFVSPYYRDDSMLLGLGFTPYQLMLQLLGKADDIFSGGREYYAHPSYRGADKPTIIHQSSATGMQAIPASGIAQGLKYLQAIGSPLFKKGKNGEMPLVVCSMGDASVTEGEVSEAFQFAVLKKLGILFLVQDNGWGISVPSKEARIADAFDYAAGFPGLERLRIDGSDFEQSYQSMGMVIEYVRKNRTPYIVQAKVPLLNHHTSGVRKETYRSKEDLANHALQDPIPKLKNLLLQNGMSEKLLSEIEKEAEITIAYQFKNAMEAREPAKETVKDFIFVPTAIVDEIGERAPLGNEKIIMVDAALSAIKEILEEFPEAIVYGQDVGRRLGGVFRETANLAQKFGDHRVFNTAIQEAYIIGSTVGICATGAKPIVEIQFADYIYPGFNQLVSEVSKSCYLTMGKFPIQTLIRIPVGAYGGGGPYHSASIETTLLSIKGIKIVYPSNAADMKGLMRAAFLDPNPVIMLEHKGLYWSKVPGTENAKTVEPSSGYIIPLGKAHVVLEVDDHALEHFPCASIVTYGMGVFWAEAAAKQFPGQIEIIDLRTLFPLDEDLVFSSVKKIGKCLILTEEQQNNSFAEALAGRISHNCFSYLDAPVEVLGALNLPAVPLNKELEYAMLPNQEVLAHRINQLLLY